jgi:peptide/nickel transport system permease protein
VPLIQGIVIVTAVLFAITNLVVDLLYPLLDPRLKAKLVTA